MEQHEAWRKLIEWQVPKLYRLLEDPDIPTPKPKKASVDEVGRLDFDLITKTTRTKSFTRFLTLHPELGACVLWYSYRTCIVKYSLEHELVLKSSKFYSRSTVTHSEAIAIRAKEFIHYNGDVGNDKGELTPEVIVRTAHDQYVGHMESFPRIRNLARWLGEACMERAEYERVMDQLNVRLRIPELSALLKEKGLAKLLGTGLNNPGVAREIADYKSLKERLDQ